jgi:hypothetical protein
MDWQIHGRDCCILAVKWQNRLSLSIRLKCDVIGMDNLLAKACSRLRIMYAVVISVMVIEGSSLLEWSAKYAVMVLLHMALAHYKLSPQVYASASF